MSISSALNLDLLKKRFSILRPIQKSLKPFLIFLIISFTSSLKLYADDPGIAKVRLIQQSDTTFAFEVDIPQSYLGTFQAPILPDGFTITSPKREFQSGWVTLKAKITSSSKGFHPDDIVVLPWNRNAVDITAQWLNGKTFKGFFTRSLNGIQVPMNQIMLVQLSTQEVLENHLLSGLKHWPFKLVHLLLIITLVLAAPDRNFFKLLLAFTLGQMTSMIFAEMRIIGFDLLFSDLILLLLVVYISFHLIRHKELKSLTLIVFFTALLHGISFSNELHAENLLMGKRIQAMFAFNLAIDLINYIVGALLLIIIPRLGKLLSKSSVIPIITGSIAVFSIILIFNENIFANQKLILDFQKSNSQVQVQANANSGANSSAGITRSKGLMTSPIMIFLSVEPYETRKEILIKGSEVIRVLGLEVNDYQTFPVESQERIKREIELLVGDFDTTFINNQSTEAERIVANFVTLGRGGVSIKETAVDENVDEAILGISINYLTQNFPDSVLFNWHLFPESENIDLSLVDPHASFAGVINPSANSVKWESRIKGFKLPAIEPIEVENEPVAIVSYTLWLFLLISLSLVWYYRRKAIQNNTTKMIIVSLVVLGFILFPFARPAVGISALSHGKPSQEKGAIILNDLLSNVYRAFDRKQEDVVYDRLAMSVTTEQLTEIYLQNRQSMALENRGGARATVDEVKLSNIYEITKSGNGEYIADAEWTVRGSVNHFGHTHYRQNQYRAKIIFIIEDNYWKINSIEILDARRLY